MMTDDVKRIVDALRTCHSNEDCRDCKYIESDKDEMSCVNMLFVDTADLIESLAAELEQVEQERDGLNILLTQAQSMLETRTRERDVAVEDIPRACGYCKHYEENTDQCTNSLPCACVSGINTRWQWRGVRED